MYVKQTSNPIYTQTLTSNIIQKKVHQILFASIKEEIRIDLTLKPNVQMFNSSLKHKPLL